MKKLSNVSPFILLLVPIFAMMILAFAATKSPSQDEMANTNTITTGAIVKATTAILK